MKRVLTVEMLRHELAAARQHRDQYRAAVEVAEDPSPRDAATLARYCAEVDVLARLLRRIGG